MKERYGILVSVAHEPFLQIAQDVVLVLEGIGVLVIVVGIVSATITFATTRRQKTCTTGHHDLSRRGYKQFRQDVGYGILLGLEFFVAADIIKTVTDPKVDGLIELGGIILIRTFLSISLQLELEGRYPWR
jgi:uncharacterized membrane protein